MAVSSAFNPWVVQGNSEVRTLRRRVGIYDGERGGRACELRDDADGTLVRARLRRSRALGDRRASYWVRAMSNCCLAPCKPVLRRFWLTVAIAACLPVCSAQESSITNPTPTVDQIVAAMMSRNDARTAALHGYVVRRIDELQSRGFPGNRSAKMTVEVRYFAPATKQFTVVSESGSKFIIDHVQKRLVSGEQEAEGLNNRKEIALTPRNYRFTCLDRRRTADAGSTC